MHEIVVTNLLALIVDLSGLLFCSYFMLDDLLIMTLFFWIDFDDGYEQTTLQDQGCSPSSRPTCTRWSMGFGQLA